ncbi:hypothetical protein M378DRAFT_333637 [Amanita muscaria Koide BX008]|uniref:Uncharacterized protein n=1 Tax=Amanita muscaria (strain Koide BX008) TaxID=946122 RepID=A0A0C2SVY4_AMAMK|nr:hypothetical protein M378DRAFT_333637 [Amanita muscaria Koide BX008]
MSQFTRTINISCKDLGGSAPIFLLLTFDDQPMQGIYKDYFPVVWRLATFMPEGSYVMTATYNNQLVFVNPKIEYGNVTSAATWINIDPGEQTELTEQSDSATKSFTQPTDGAGDNTVKATNKTQNPQTIGVGFDNGNSDIQPPTLLVFNETGSGHNVTAEFTPTLSAYVVGGYQEGSILRGAIATPAAWKRDLAALPETSNWKLERQGDPVFGKYSITAA